METKYPLWETRPLWYYLLASRNVDLVAYCRHNHRLLTIVEKNSSQMARGTASTYLLYAIQTNNILEARNLIHIIVRKAEYVYTCIILFSTTYKSTYFFIFRGTIASRGWLETTFYVLCYAPPARPIMDELVASNTTYYRCDPFC